MSMHSVSTPNSSSDVRALRYILPHWPEGEHRQEDGCKFRAFTEEFLSKLVIQIQQTQFTAKHAHFHTHATKKDFHTP